LIKRARLQTVCKHTEGLYVSGSSGTFSLGGQWEVYGFGLGEFNRNNYRSLTMNYKLIMQVFGSDA